MPAFVSTTVTGAWLSLSSNTRSLTIANSVSAGNTMILGIALDDAGATATSVSDTQGNVWQLDASDLNQLGNFMTTYIFSAPVTTALTAAVDTLTVHLSGTSTRALYAYAEQASGIAQTNYVDQKATVHGANQGSFTATIPGSSRPNEWAFSVLGFIDTTGGITITQPTNFTSRAASAQSLNGYSADADNLIVSVSSVSANWTWGGGTLGNGSACLVLYTPQSTGDSGSNYESPHLIVGDGMSRSDVAN